MRLHAIRLAVTAGVALAAATLSAQEGGVRSNARSAPGGVAVDVDGHVANAPGSEIDVQVEGKGGPAGGHQHWRYKWYDGRWWYWKPTDQWCFYDHGGNGSKGWVDYDRSTYGQYSRGYQGGSRSSSDRYNRGYQGQGRYSNDYGNGYQGQRRYSNDYGYGNGYNGGSRYRSGYRGSDVQVELNDGRNYGSNRSGYGSNYGRGYGSGYGGNSRGYGSNYGRGYGSGNSRGGSGVSISPGGVRIDF